MYSYVFMTTLSFLSFSYQCLDPTQMIAHSANEDFLENKVQVECLFNGRWSYSIEEFGCTHCERPMKPLNGKFDCESFNFTEQSSCLLVIIGRRPKLFLMYWITFIFIEM